jgi:CheY-like chemotaxis protein
VTERPDPVRVLIADDDDASRRMLADLLDPLEGGQPPPRATLRVV